MARGRMITNRIASDTKINQLVDDTSRLAFTWLITFADVEGRTYGDPAMVRSMIFPRRDNITIEQIQGYIRQWAELGLIYWYQANDDLWIEFINFKKNQPNMRDDREPKSEIPAYRPDDGAQDDENYPADIRQTSGIYPANIPVKRREEKRREEKSNGRCDYSSAQAIIQEVTGWMAIPGNHDEVMHMLGIVMEIYDRQKDGTAEYLTQYWQAFKERYPRSTKLFWLTDWAVQGKIPPKQSKTLDGRGGPVKQPGGFVS